MAPYIVHYESPVGGGVDGIFTKALYDRGHGLWSFLGGLRRHAERYLIRGARAVGKEVVLISVNILVDVANNTPFKDAFRARITESIRSLMQKAKRKIENLIEGSECNIHDGEQFPSMV